jgi:WD domain, G-beta repeat
MPVGFDAFLIPTGVYQDNQHTVIKATLVVRPFIAPVEAKTPVPEHARGREEAESAEGLLLLADWPAYVRRRLFGNPALGDVDSLEPYLIVEDGLGKAMEGNVTSPKLNRCYHPIYNSKNYKGDVATDVKRLWGRVFSDQGGANPAPSTFYGLARALYRDSQDGAGGGSGLINAVTQPVRSQQDGPKPGADAAPPPPAPNILFVPKASLAHVKTMQRAKIIDARIEASNSNPPGEPDIRQQDMKIVTKILTPDLGPFGKLPETPLPPEQRKLKTQENVKAALKAEREAIQTTLQEQLKPPRANAQKTADRYFQLDKSCQNILDSRRERFERTGIAAAASRVANNQADLTGLALYTASTLPDPDPEEIPVGRWPANPIASRLSTVLGIPSLQRVLHLTVDIEARLEKVEGAFEAGSIYRFRFAVRNSGLCNSRSTLAKVGSSGEIWPCTDEERFAPGSAKTCGAVDQFDGLLNLEMAIGVASAGVGGHNAAGDDKAGHNGSDDKRNLHRFSIDTLDVHAAMEAEIQRARAYNFVRSASKQSAADTASNFNASGESAEADALRAAAAERKLKTAGVQLFDQWRGDVAIKQYVAAIQATNPSARKTYLDADDLTAGVALDVGFEAKGGRRWACLTNRHISYSRRQAVGDGFKVDLEGLAEIFVENGLNRKESRLSLDGVFISMPARLVSIDDDADPQSSQATNLTAFQETSVAVWDGDPLGVRCKSERTNVHFDGLPIDMTFSLAREHDGVPLPPRLRIGAPYWLGGRTVLLGGVKRTFDDRSSGKSVIDEYEGDKEKNEPGLALPGSPLEYRRFLRHEWIDAPMAATPVHEVFEEFSTLRGLDGETLVVRSGPQTRPTDTNDAQRYGPSETRRVLCAPPVDFNFVHLHGVFDSGADPNQGGLRDVDYEPARGGFPSFSPQRFPAPNNIRFEASGRLEKLGIDPDVAQSDTPAVPDGGLAIFRPRSISQNRKSDEIYLPDPAARYLVVALKKRSRKGHYLEGCPIITPLYPEAGGEGPTTQGYPDALPVIIRLVTLPHGSDEPLTRYEQIAERAKAACASHDSSLSHVWAQTVTIPLLPGENFDLIAWCVPEPAHIGAWFDMAESLAFYAKGVCGLDPKKRAKPPSDTLNYVNGGKNDNRLIRREEETVPIGSVTRAAEKIHNALCRFPLPEFAAPRRLQIIHAVEKPAAPPEILSRKIPGGADPWARLYETISFRRVDDTDHHKLLARISVLAVAFLPRGWLALAGSDDRTARLWDASTGAAATTLEGHTGAVRAVAFSPEGSRVLTGSADAKAKVWNASNGPAVATLGGHTDAVLAVAFSPDGNRILTGSADMTAKLWDAATFAPIAALEEHTDVVRAVAFSSDGKRILTGSDDGTARVWDASTGAALATLHGHTDAVRVVAFSAHGDRIVTGSDDKTARLWDASTAAAVATLVGHSQAVRAVTFSLDGNHVLTGSDDETARTWDAATGVAGPTLNGTLEWRGLLREKPDSGVASVVVDADVTLDPDMIDSIELRVTAVAPTGRPLDNPNLGRIPEDRIRGDWPDNPSDSSKSIGGPENQVLAEDLIQADWLGDPDAGDESKGRLSASRRLYGFDVFADGRVHFPPETAVMQRWTIARRDDFVSSREAVSLIRLSQDSERLSPNAGASASSAEERLFANGGARRVHSRIFATSRTAKQIPDRQVYPDAQEQKIDLTRRYVWSGDAPETPPPQSILRSVVRPAALPVHSLLPAFVWSEPASQPKTGAAMSRSTRIRIPFSRPAMTSGVEERVGIVLWPPNILGSWIEVNKDKALWDVTDLAQGKIRPIEPLPDGGGSNVDMNALGSGPFTDDDLGPGGVYVTRWGADPIHPEGELGWFIGLNSFADQPYWAKTAIDSIDAEDKDTGILWPECDVYKPRFVKNVLMPLPKSETDANPKSKDTAAAPVAEGKAADDHQFMMVSLLTYAPRFDVDTERWYVDVDIDPGASPDPFLRLGLVRFQPHAARNLQVSFPTAEWVQIVGKRRDVKVEVYPPAPNQFRYFAVVTVESPLIERVDDKASNSRRVVSMEPVDANPDSPSDPSGAPTTMIRATLIERHMTDQNLTFERSARRGKLDKSLSGGEELEPIQATGRVRFGRLENGSPASVVLCLELPDTYGDSTFESESGSIRYAVFVEEYLSMKAANQNGQPIDEQAEQYTESGTRFAVKLPIPGLAI